MEKLANYKYSTLIINILMIALMCISTIIDNLIAHIIILCLFLLILILAAYSSSLIVSDIEVLDSDLVSKTK